MGIYKEVMSEGARRGEVEAALAAVLATPEFVRAPVMRRLLEYLVHETLNGRGDQVKAYSVAVDGLGRDPDFDTQADSYPRVQVGRLRRMLDAHYARNVLVSGVGLSIPNGSYKVHFISPGEALVPPKPLDVPEHTWTAPGAAYRDWRWTAAVVATGLLLCVVILWAFFHPLKTVAKSELAPNPVMEVQRMAADAGPDAARLAARTDLVLGDALYRSFVTVTQAGATGAAPNIPDYRLTGRVSGSAGAATLSVQVYHVQSGRQIWSETVPLPVDDARIPEAMRPMIARLIQPFGIIATDQRARFTDPATPGFPCLMLYQDYTRTHDQALRGTVNACLDRTSILDPSRAAILAARSFMAYDASAANPGNADSLQTLGASLARDAVNADPFSGAGHFALASAFYYQGRCDLGKASAMRSMEMNPYSADKVAALGGFMFQCGDPDAEHYLRDAIALDPNGPAYSRTPLIILLIQRGDRQEALALANAIVPPMDSTRIYYDLTMALAQSANGNRGAAKASWDGVMRACGGRVDRLDSIIGGYVLSPGLRRATFDALVQAGLLDRAALDAGKRR